MSLFIDHEEDVNREPNDPEEDEHYSDRYCHSFVIPYPALDREVSSQVRVAIVKLEAVEQ